MPSSLNFFNPQTDKFDNTEAFSSFFSEILYPECHKAAKALVGEDGNVEEATKIEITNRLNELLVDAVNADAMRIVLSIDIMVEKINSYDGKYQDLHELASESDILFNNLCKEGYSNSFERVYIHLRQIYARDEILSNIKSDDSSALAKKKEEKLEVVRDELLEISLEGASIDNINALVADMGITKTDLLTYALSKDFPKYGTLVYALYHNLDTHAEAIVDLCLNDGSDIEGYGLLKDFVDLALQDSNVQALRLLSRISLVEDYYADHSLGIMQTSSLNGDLNVLGFFLLERGEIFAYDDVEKLESLMRTESMKAFAYSNIHDIFMASVYHGAPNCYKYLLKFYPNIFREAHESGFPMWHILSEQAIFRCQEDILQEILNHHDYDPEDKSLLNTPHLHILFEIASESDSISMVNFLVRKLSNDNGNKEPQIIDLLKKLVTKEKTITLEAILRSKAFDSLLKEYAEKRSEVPVEYQYKVMLNLLSGALYQDKADSFAVIYDSYETMGLSSESQKVIILEIASNCEATECIEAMSNDFIFNAILYSMGAFENAQAVGDSEVHQRTLSNILQEVYNAKGNEIVNQQITEEGENLLMLALTYGLKDVAIYIIDNLLQDELMQEEAVKMVDSEMQNIVHLAVFNNDPALLKKILSMKGASNIVNAQDDEGHTPATLAIVELEEEAASIIEVLAKEGGADLSLLGAEDLSALDWAISVTTGKPTLLFSTIEGLVKEQAEYWKSQEEDLIKDKSFTTSKYGTFTQEAFDEGMPEPNETLRKAVLGEGGDKKDVLIRQRRLSDASDTKSDSSISSTTSSADGELHMYNVGAVANYSLLHPSGDFTSCAHEHLSALGLECSSIHGPPLVY